jgi:hypothetical protein
MRRDAIEAMNREGEKPYPDGTEIQLFKSNQDPDFNALSLPPV